LRTLGGPFLALLLQGDGESLPAASAPTIVQLIAESSGVHKAVLLILAVFSVLSWGIVLYKLWVFRRSERQSASFLAGFRRSSKFSEVQAVCKSLGDSPLVGLFQAGYAELSAQLRHSQPVVEAVGAGANPRAGTSRPVLRSLTAVDRALLRASVVEVNKLEERVAFLATTASITPFIGLFGTVWGIMMSFQGIGQTGSTNLGVVAPGIAEALVATAAGLFAAIPAVYFYNHLSQQVKRFATQLDDFSMEFLNITERNFT
jgi:biopolymer transport protein TolQ